MELYFEAYVKSIKNWCNLKTLDQLHFHTISDRVSRKKIIEIYYRKKGPKSKSLMEKLVI